MPPSETLTPSLALALTFALIGTQVERPTEATASQLYAYFRVLARDRFNNTAAFRPATYTSVECIASPLRLPDRDDATPAVVTVAQETDELTAQFAMSWLVRVATTWAGQYDLTFRVDGQPLNNLVRLDRFEG